MILDDVFAQAVSDQKPNIAVTVFVAVTTNQTGGFRSTTNKSSAAAPAQLTYTASAEESGGPLAGRRRVPAFFSGGGIKIVEPPPNLVGPGHYTVDIFGTSFIPTVDPVTNIIFGVAGSVFVTISLCSYAAGAVLK
jgi:hypothetical protein